MFDEEVDHDDALLVVVRGGERASEDCPDFWVKTSPQGLLSIAVLRAEDREDITVSRAAVEIMEMPFCRRGQDGVSSRSGVLLALVVASLRPDFFALDHDPVEHLASGVAGRRTTPLAPVPRAGSEDVVLVLVTGAGIRRGRARSSVVLLLVFSEAEAPPVKLCIRSATVFQLGFLWSSCCWCSSF